jgi:hypothetical protein
MADRPQAILACDIATEVLRLLAARAIAWCGWASRLRLPKRVGVVAAPGRAAEQTGDMEVTAFEEPARARTRARLHARPIGRLAAVGCLAMLVVACGSNGSGPTPSPPSQSPTLAPTATSSASSPPTTSPSRNPIAAGMCRAGQLAVAITYWEGNTGSPIAHVTATNISPASCDMRGLPDAQMIDGNGAIIADPGAGSASATPADPALTLQPGESAQTTVTWSNYCQMVQPVQNVTVAFVLPLGLGRVVATTTARAQVPDCQGTAETPLRVTVQPWER